MVSLKVLVLYGVVIFVRFFATVAALIAALAAVYGVVVGIGGLLDWNRKRKDGKTFVHSTSE